MRDGVSQDDTERAHSLRNRSAYTTQLSPGGATYPEREAPLEERDGSSAVRAKAWRWSVSAEPFVRGLTTLTSVHDVDVRISPAHFGVQDDKADRPIRHDAKHDEEDDAREESCFSERVRET